MKCFSCGSLSWFTIPDLTPKERKLQEPLITELGFVLKRLTFTHAFNKNWTESFPLNVNKKSSSSKLVQNNRWLELKTAVKSNFLSQAEKKTIPQGSDDQVFFLYIGNLNISIYRLYGGNTCILGGTGKGDLVVIPVAWGLGLNGGLMVVKG